MSVDPTAGRGSKRFKPYPACGVWGEDFDDEGVIVLRSTDQTVDGRWLIDNPAERRLTVREASEARLEVADLVVTKSSGSEKDSGLEWFGAIPTPWTVLHLRRVIDRFVDYRGQTPEKTPSGVRLVTARNIKHQKIDFSASEEFIAEDVYERWMVRGLPEHGDVLVTTEAPLGEVAQIDDANIALAQRLILLKADKTRATNDYLKYHFAADSGRAELWSKATGSTALGIKASHLKATLIPVPPVADQSAIARHLDLETAKIDVLLDRVSVAIEQINELRTALVSAAVTGKIDVRDDRIAEGTQI